MRVSRPCYDKMHRCPGWAGGGNRHAKRDRCSDGRLVGAYDGSLYTRFFWRWRFNRCTSCDVLVLPYVVRYLDPTNWRSEIKHWYWRHDGSHKGFFIESAEPDDNGFGAVCFAGREPDDLVSVYVGIQLGKHAWLVGWSWW